MNGSHPDYVELSDSTYEKLPENTQGTITGVSQNSNECDNPGNSDRVQKSHSSTFLPQPNILEKGDSRLSNHYGPSVTTKQLNTSYVFVESVQETSREVKLPPTPYSSLTDDTSQYSLDLKDYKPLNFRSLPPTPSSCLTDDTSQYSLATKDYKPRSKKICKYLLWILIILGISAVIAISTVYYQNSQLNQITNSMEAQRDGNNEINKTLGIVLDKLNSIKQSIETNNNVNMKNDFTTQRSPGYSSSEPLLDSSNSGQCRNATNGECVKDCQFMCRGDYQSCETCKGYVSCEYGHLTKRFCINPRFNITLFWDDKLKGCEFESSTCDYK